MDRDSLHLISVIVITQGGVIYRAGHPDCYTFRCFVGVSVTKLFVLSFFSCLFFPSLFLYQAQASNQFLANTKLATNKAICLKVKKIIRVNKRFLATNNKYIALNA